MRPAGGYTPEMYNYSQETDVYKIWAYMVCFDKNTKPIGNHHYCAFYGRRDGKTYKLDDYEIMMKYKDNMKMWILSSMLLLSDIDELVVYKTLVNLKKYIAIYESIISREKYSGGEMGTDATHFIMMQLNLLVVTEKK